MTGSRHLTCDVAVIGGGLGGLSAAIAAAKAGRKVVVIRRGLGATAMSSGGLDFPLRLPVLHGTTRPAPRDVATPGRAQATLDPSEAASLLRDWFAAAGLELVGRPGEDLPLLDVAGHLRRTTLALAPAAAGRVDRWADGKVLFCGVEGYAPYRPEWTAKMAAWLGLLGPERAACDTVPAPGLHGEAGLSSARIARALDRPEGAKAFAASVAKAAKRAGADLVALPPVLGLENSVGVYRELATALAKAMPQAGVTAFELLSPPPSVPGQRLQLILDRIAREAGVSTLPGRVVETSGAGALASVAVDLHGRGLVVEAAQYVLAAGTFAAGGLRAEGQVVVEPLFGLPVFGPPPPGFPAGEVPLGCRPVRELVWDRFAARHPVFEAGLAVDGSLRPLDASGRPAFANLRAAGSIVGGYNRFADGAGAGVAATTGVAAGRLAAAAVAEERRRPA